MKRCLLLPSSFVADPPYPHQALQDQVPQSTSIWSADGELLRVTLAADQQYRLWTPLNQMSPSLIQAFLLKEDTWYYWHPGLNPAALLRAANKTWRGEGRQGGSTITMQLARLLYHLNTRTPAGKLRQSAAALWLEARYSKRSILEAYLNLVPFGGNIQGVGVASRVYFAKPHPKSIPPKPSPSPSFRKGPPPGPAARERRRNFSPPEPASRTTGSIPITPPNPNSANWNCPS